MWYFIHPQKIHQPAWGGKFFDLCPLNKIHFQKHFKRAKILNFKDK
jgi:hypothetical protein